MGIYSASKSWDKSSCFWRLTRYIDRVILCALGARDTLEEVIMWRVLNFLVGLIAGAMIGMSVVILIAPQAGQETRAQFRARMDGILAEGRKAYQQRRLQLEARLVDMEGDQTG
jgi:hypothetical protein